MDRGYTLLEVLLLLGILGILAAVGMRILGRNTAFENTSTALQAFLDGVSDITQSDSNFPYYLLIGNSHGVADSPREMILVKREENQWISTDLYYNLQNSGEIVEPGDGRFEVSRQSQFPEGERRQIPGLPGNWYVIPWGHGAPAKGGFQLVLVSRLPENPSDHRFVLRGFTISDYGTVVPNQL